MEYYFSQDDALLKKEKKKARELRNSQWWKRKRSQGICYYCRGSFPPKTLTMDHIVPMARGGKSVKNNVVPCCKECNSKKKQLLPLEWTAYMETLSASPRE
ncbi:HNH endonuclease [Desulfocicer vacuolatum DSM 3385]|uniref:HNH endonuclease n=1 Tax=Desulfocicer vacuolatum DSM 3385 TaxID=1121400 RepID=A0A1W2DB59_9BACT|nr:HNH endonuclease [Desulfocicer vacuolatum]SMC94484.1 HNH endonuclease [Desulfocicer vacuolatum DSM 3385]